MFRTSGWVVVEFIEQRRAVLFLQIRPGHVAAGVGLCQRGVPGIAQMSIVQIC